MPGTGLDHDRSESIADRPYVLTSGGRRRPPMPRPCTKLVIHYIGAGQHWLDAGDTAQEIWSIEKNHARPSGKPDEYNSASDAQGETWEWAGPFMAAHNGSGSWGNGRAWGHVVLLGVEIPTAAQTAAIVAGIRRARRQLVASGCLSADHAIAPHGPVSSTNTPCPGPLGTGATWQAIAAPLGSPIEPPKPPIQEDDMFTDEDRANLNLALKIAKDEQTRSANRYQVYTGRFQMVIGRLNLILRKLGVAQESLDEIDDTVDEIANGTR